MLSASENDAQAGPVQECPPRRKVSEIFLETIGPAPIILAADTRLLIFYKILRDVVNRQIPSKIVTNSFKIVTLPNFFGNGASGA